MALTHYLLLELRATAAQAGALGHSLAGLCAQTTPWALPERLALHSEQGLAYAYLRLREARELDPAELQPLQAAWQAQGAAPLVRACRLQEVLRVPGRSQGQVPLHHYAVETDPEDGWEDEIFRWYDQEHMPGLAAVPGCTLAQRLINHDAGPRSHACYGLLRTDTPESPPWLAVRHTAWSSRCRPHFTNTRRTMFEVVPL